MRFVSNWNPSLNLRPTLSFALHLLLAVILLLVIILLFFYILAEITHNFENGDEE